MQVVTASSRGQIVIPKEIRKRLNIVAGKRLSVKAEGDRVLLTPLPDDRWRLLWSFQGAIFTYQVLTEHREKDKHR